MLPWLSMQSQAKVGSQPTAPTCWAAILACFS